MEFIEDLKILKHTYQEMKKGDGFDGFIDGMIRYFHFLKFDQHKSLMILGLLRGVLPLPGESFTSCDTPQDERDFSAVRKVQNSFKEEGDQ